MGEEVVEVSALRNRLPKGIMWSAIPVALLCMIVNWISGSKAAAQKGIHEVM